MLLDNLNEPQKKAVSHIDGPLLVLAGPGSGKTRVITHRIANLIFSGIPSYKILAVTFTNKAAQEMQKRVQNLIGQEAKCLVCTFHSLCARILRRECSILEYNENFSIFDTDDQKRAMKYVLAELKIEVAAAQMSEYLSKIGRYKNKGILPQDISTSNPWEKKFHQIYTGYQKYLRQNNAFDFDDLLLKTLELFTNYKDVLDYYQEKFLYILIDEFQDTNLPQYHIAKLLGEKYRNICATGDPDQSIYSWRGADIRNILEFEKDFPETVVVKLEQNYRSTGYILQAASNIISHNKLRKEKELWTQNSFGNLIQIVSIYDDFEEANWIASKIQEWKQHYALKDIAIFYRMNSQSRALETVLRGHSIPYTIVGGLEFYQRAEIKDILAYLRVIANEKDDISLMRILNVPARGFGKKALETITTISQAHQWCWMQALRSSEIHNFLSKKTSSALTVFLNMIDELREKENKVSLSELVTQLLQQSGYKQYIEEQDIKQDEDRLENLKEFLLSIHEYETMFQDKSLSNFLQRISLVSANDQKPKEENEDSVTLMTLHAAKGLEFPCVFIVGAVDGIIPHKRSMSEEEIEEERRLFFVGITRAQKNLTISYTKLNLRDHVYNDPSPFLEDIPKNITKFIKMNQFPTI